MTKKEKEKRNKDIKRLYLKLREQGNGCFEAKQELANHYNISVNQIYVIIKK